MPPVLEHEVVQVAVVGPGGALFEDALPVVEDDVVGHEAVVVRPLGLIEVAAADHDARTGSGDGIAGDLHVVGVVPELDAGAGHPVDHVAADARLGADMDAAVVRAVHRADVVHVVADDVGLLALVIAVHPDPGAAGRLAGNVERDVMDVIVADAVVGAAVVDTVEPLGAALVLETVDVEADDVDVAAAVVPAAGAARIERRHDLGAPALGRDEDDARLGVAADPGLEAAHVLARRDVDGGARRDDLGRARDRAEGFGLGARIGIRTARRHEQVGAHDFRNHHLLRRSFVQAAAVEAEQQGAAQDCERPIGAQASRGGGRTGHGKTSWAADTNAVSPGANAARPGLLKFVFERSQRESRKPMHAPARLSRC